MHQRRQLHKTSPQRGLREDLIAQACLEAYGQVRHEGRLADRALEFTLRRKKNLYSQERRAVAERVYALLRTQRTVDYLLEQVHPKHSALPTTRLDLLRLSAARVLQGEDTAHVARSGALQPADVAALERLPEAAAKLEALPAPERFPIAASLPDFLAQRFWEELGPEAEALAAALNERAPLTARVNTLRATRDEVIEKLRAEGVEARPTPLSPLGLFLDTRQNAFSLTTFREGYFELQDEGSQLLGMLVDAPPTQVADACAGAGGKTLQLAAQMKNRGELHALDIDAGRLEEAKRRARRAGVHNVRLHPLPRGGAPAEALTSLVGRMDRVLVDAPCSGTGTFRRKPDARYRLTEEDLAAHITRQRALLMRFATLVKPGGRLIYGTCSVLREENEDVVAHFLGEHPEFMLIPVADRLGEALGARVSRAGQLRLFSHVHGTDGFFGAILRRSR